jgi:predicted nucleic acid-binding protein
MSVEPAREFVDTNVLVYAYDTTAAEKRNVARQLMAELWLSGRGCLSVQVLQEFYVNVTRKVQHPMDHTTARRRLENLSRWLIHSPTGADVLEAIDLHGAHRISFWDAMILVSAKRLKCAVVWSEDLTDGQVIAGARVRNPFGGSHRWVGGAN